MVLRITLDILLEKCNCIMTLQFEITFLNLQFAYVSSKPSKSSESHYVCFHTHLLTVKLLVTMAQLAVPLCLFLH
jgi:hypothetical protein